MEERLRCKKCGARFTQDGVDDALEAEELICPRCGHLFTKADLGPRDWLHRPINPRKYDLWIYGAMVLGAVFWEQPVLALFALISILVGLLFAWLIGRARWGDGPVSIVGRKSR